MGVTISRVCFGKVKSEARPNQLITFVRCRREAAPIKYRDLPSAAFNQTGTFKLPGSIRDGRPLDTQHFGDPGGPGGVERTRATSLRVSAARQRAITRPPPSFAAGSLTRTHTHSLSLSDPGEHVTDGGRKPLAAPSRRDTPAIESACDGRQ